MVSWKRDHELGAFNWKNTVWNRTTINVCANGQREIANKDRCEVTVVDVKKHFLEEI